MLGREMSEDQNYIKCNNHIEARQTDNGHA